VNVIAGNYPLKRCTRPALNNFHKTDVAVLAAAVADYKPVNGCGRSENKKERGFPLT
jgi:hypothetical protein